MKSMSKIGWVHQEGFKHDVPDKFFQGGDRLCWLDVTRTAAVVGMAIHRSYPLYTQFGFGFGQSWAPQLASVISGICFSTSSRGIILYIARLFVYLSIGYAFNFLAYAAQNGWNTACSHPVAHIRQMWLVIGFVSFCILCWPAKWLRIRNPVDLGDIVGRNVLERLPLTGDPVEVTFSTQDQLRRHILFTLLMTLQSFCCLASVHIVYHEFSRSLLELFARGGFWFELSTTWNTYLHIDIAMRNLALVLLYPWICGCDFIGWIPWTVLGNMYLSRIACAGNRLGHGFHLFNLFLLGVIANRFGMRGRPVLQKYFLRYWFLVPFICGLLIIPGLPVLIEEYPLQDFVPRLRYNLVEVILLVAWLVAGERMVDPGIVMEDGICCIGSWGLLVYLLHVALFQIYPFLFGWAIMISMIIPCWAYNRAVNESLLTLFAKLISRNSFGHLNAT